MGDTPRELDYNILSERISAQTETYVEFSNVLLKLIELIGDLKDSISNDKQYIIEILLKEIESSKINLDFAHKDTVNQLTIFFNKILTELTKASDSESKHYDQYIEKILKTIDQQTIILNKLNNILSFEERRKTIKYKVYTYLLATVSIIGIIGVLIQFNIIQLNFFPKQ